MKRCPTCQTETPPDGYYRQEPGAECKPCVRARSKANRAKLDPVAEARRRRSTYLLQTYGITLEEFDQLLEAQGGCCAICGVDEPGGQTPAWHIDHDHATGAVRGLLCRSCNSRLGVVENHGWMQSAAAYLADPPFALLIFEKPRPKRRRKVAA